jgi:probable F420-dependent oxidoreductase
VRGRLQFGTNISISAAPDADPSAEARRAEELGFDFVSCSDHLHGGYPTFETWTVLTWMAAATTRIRVASDVLGLPYRPPPLLAKMAESLDRLSGGRLILGLGGGGSDDEFRAFGLTQRSPGEKVEALGEAVEILRGLWANPTFTFPGRHFRLEDAQIEPKPQRSIPIWLGTYGPRALALTGRVADGWIPSFRLAPPERVPAMRARILTAADAVGRDAAAITFACNVGVRVDDQGDPRPYVVSGPPDQVAEELGELVRLGFDSLNLWPAGAHPDEQRERLAGEVFPGVVELTS